jgi:putative membrane protein
MPPPVASKNQRYKPHPRVIWQYITVDTIGFAILWLMLLLRFPSLGFVFPLLLPLSYLYVYLWYRYFSYELRPKELVIMKGIIKKHIAVISYSRIQNIDIVMTLLERLFGLATIKIQTAGKSGVAGAEGLIPGLRKQRAFQLRKILLSYANQKEMGNSLATSPSSPVPRQLSPKTVWLFFLSDFTSLVFPALIAISGIAAFSIYIGIHARLHIREMFILPGAFAAVISVIFIIPPSLLSLIWNYLWWRSFRYYITPQEIQVEKGVINRKFTAVPYSRVQNIDIYRSLLHRLLGLSSLSIQTAGKSGVAGAELTIPGLLARDAESLREEVLNYVHRSSQNSRESSAAGL